MIKFKQKGDFKKTKRFLTRMGSGDYLRGLDNLARIGVDALKESTPKKTGKTSESWDYSYEKTSNGISINWFNTNVNDGVNVAILIQYGHGMPSGYYVAGIDYINPALRPIFDAIGEKMWEEVTRDA